MADKFSSYQRRNQDKSFRLTEHQDGSILLPSPGQDGNADVGIFIVDPADGVCKNITNSILSGGGLGGPSWSIVQNVTITQDGGAPFEAYYVRNNTTEAEYYAAKSDPATPLTGTIVPVLTNQIIRLFRGMTELTFDIGVTTASRRDAFASMVAALQDGDNVVFPQGFAFKISDTVISRNNIKIDFSGSVISNNQPASANLLTISGHRNQISNFSISTNGTAIGRCLLVSGDDNLCSDMQFTGCTAITGAPFYDTGANNQYVRWTSVNQLASIRLNGKGTLLDQWVVYNHTNNHAISSNTTQERADFTLSNFAIVVDGQPTPWNFGFINFNTFPEIDDRIGTIKLENGKLIMPTPTNDVTIAMFKAGPCERLIFDNVEWDYPTPAVGVDPIRLSNNETELYTGPYLIEQVFIKNCDIRGRISAGNESFRSVEIENSLIDMSVDFNVRFLNSISMDSFVFKDSTYRGKDGDLFMLPINDPFTHFENAIFEGNNVRVFAHAQNFNKFSKCNSQLNQNGATGQKWVLNAAHNEFLSFKIDGSKTLYRWEPGLMSADQGGTCGGSNLYCNASNPPASGSIGTFDIGALTVNLTDPLGDQYFWAGNQWNLIEKSNLQAITDKGNVTTNDLEVTDATKGLILTNGTNRFRYTLDGAGDFVKTQL